MVNVKHFIEEFHNKKIQNTQIKPNAVSDYLKETLEIKEYIPFNTKRQIVEMVVAQNTKFVDGIKKNDAIGQYVGFVVAMIASHSNLEFSENPVEDYDALAESGLLPQIINEFKADYSECDILLKMALAMELEDNNVNALIGRFLNKISSGLDGVLEVVMDKFGDFDLKNILGADIKEEDLTKLIGLLDKLK